MRNGCQSWEEGQHRMGSVNSYIAIVKLCMKKCIKKFQTLVRIIMLPIYKVFGFWQRQAAEEVWRVGRIKEQYH